MTSRKRENLKQLVDYERRKREGLLGKQTVGGQELRRMRVLENIDETLRRTLGHEGP